MTLKKKLLHSSVALAMGATFILPSISASAAEREKTDNVAVGVEQINTVSNIELQQDEVINTIKKYVYLNLDGTISLNENIPSGIAKQYQTDKLKQRFMDLNMRVKKGEIRINQDFSIKELNNYKLRSSSSKVQRHEEYWWGHKNWYTNYQTKKAVDALYTAAGGAAIGGGLLTLGFPPAAFAAEIAAGYWTILATRMNANNSGKGVTVSMTWVMVFSVNSR